MNKNLLCRGARVEVLDENEDHCGWFGVAVEATQQSPPLSVWEVQLDSGVCDFFYASQLRLVAWDAELQALLDADAIVKRVHMGLVGAPLGFWNILQRTRFHLSKSMDAILDRGKAETSPYYHPHSKDADCSVSPLTNQCVVCGVDFGGEPCSVCLGVWLPQTILLEPNVKGGTILKSLCVTLLLMAAMAGCSAQTMNLGWTLQPVVLDGNSLSHFQHGITQNELPLLRNVRVLGHDGYTCPMVLPVIGYETPANTALMLLFNSTNDLLPDGDYGLAAHMACMYQTFAVLLAKNPNMKILVANTPPWTEDGGPGCQDGRGQWTLNAIAAFNAAYVGAPGSGYNGFEHDFPHNVRVVDVWTPNILASGWADPSKLAGPCGKHPGQSGQWLIPGEGNDGWPLFTPVTSSAIYTALQQVW